ncbi:hypothetical protein V6N13_108391 [Hibiscus sabdariffa]
MVDLRDSVAGHSRDCVPDALYVRDFPPLVMATNEGGASDGSGDVNPLGVDAACGKEILALGAKESVDWDALFSGHTLPFYPPMKRDGKIVVQPPPEVIDLGAKQWENALLGMVTDLVSFDIAHVWLKLWHVPLELYFKQGLGYLANAVGKPLYTDRATALKYHLDFAKICVEVDASVVFPSAIDVELGNGLCVECKKLVQSNVSDPKLVSEDVLVGNYGDFATRGGGGFVAGAVDCVPAVGHVGVIEGDADGVRASVVGDEPKMFSAAGDGDPVSATNASLVAFSILLVPVLGAVVGSSNDGSSSFIMEKVVGDPTNKFGVLCPVVEDQVVQYEHSRPKRAVAGGVADLMEQLKPKVKGGKKKGKGRGTNVKGPIDGASTPL